MPTDHGITRREFLTRLGLGAAGLAASSLLRPGSGLAAEPQRPNLLYIMSDQHRWDFMSGLGSPLVHTPRLDRLAREGVLFDSAYCQAPLCVPSRMSEITGRYVHSHGALSNQYALPETERTIGHHFKDHGYATGAIGKMHFQDEDQHHGFDLIIGATEYYEATGKDFKPTPYGGDPAQGVLREHTKKQTRRQGGRRFGKSAETDEQTYEHFLADRFIDWLGKKPPQPFCMWLSFHAPHPPYLTPDTYYKLYEGKVKVPEQPPPGYFSEGRPKKNGNMSEEQELAAIAAYLGRITSVDTQIGRVLAAMEKAGLMDDTVISYTADHGDMMGERSRFGKTVMYDSSARIPLIFRYPKALPRGVRRHEVVEHVDLVPTFCDLTGLPTPPTVQGRSLAPLMAGKSVNWANTAFSELADKVLVRENQYKLTCYDGKALELYDVAKDPREWHNLIDKPESKAVVERLTKLRDGWMARTTPDVRGHVQPYHSGQARARRRRVVEDAEQAQ